ncbi:hypothetical protein AKJ38_02980, partial [candidate division MSBL1 archaeon SCGC-AAA259I14]
NVSAIERNARRNIQKSERTLELAKVLKAPVTLEIGKGTELYEIPRIVFDKGDDEDININLNGPKLLRKVREDAAAVLQKKKVVGKIKVGISRDGEVSLEVGESE